MTIGHLKEIIQYLPDAMLAFTSLDIGEDSIVLPICNKSKVQQVYNSDTDQCETVLFLLPCTCHLNVEEGPEEMAHDLMDNDAIDN